MEMSEAVVKLARANEIVVRKGVPLPADGRCHGREQKYPFAEMEVGDSFVFPAGVSSARASASAGSFGKRAGGWKFTIRKTQEGVACWRIA
jgi:hypothetical protein